MASFTDVNLHRDEGVVTSYYSGRYILICGETWVSYKPNGAETCYRFKEAGARLTMLFITDKLVSRVGRRVVDLARMRKNSVDLRYEPDTGPQPSTKGKC